MLFHKKLKTKYGNRIYNYPPVWYPSLEYMLLDMMTKFFENLTIQKRRCQNIRWKLHFVNVHVGYSRQIVSLI